MLCMNQHLPFKIFLIFFLLYKNGITYLKHKVIFIKALHCMKCPLVDWPGKFFHNHDDSVEGKPFIRASFILS